MNRSDGVREPIFASCPWGIEGRTAIFCYDCHEELLHNPVLLPADIKRFARIVIKRGLSEENKLADRRKLAGRIRLLHEVIDAGMKAIIKRSKQSGRGQTPTKRSPRTVHAIQSPASSDGQWVRFSEVPKALSGKAGWYEIRFGKALLKVGISGNLLRRIRDHHRSRQSGLKGPDVKKWTNPSDVKSKSSVLAKHLYFDQQIAPRFNLMTEKGRVAFLNECQIRWTVTKTRAEAREAEKLLERSGRYRYTDDVLIRKP